MLLALCSERSGIERGCLQRNWQAEGVALLSCRGDRAWYTG